jgi:ATP-dependent Lon protease
LATRNGVIEFYSIRNAEPDANGLIELPVIPLREVVIYPNMVTPLFIESVQMLLAVEASLKAEQTVICVAQLDPELDDVTKSDLYDFGTETALGRLLRMPNDDDSVLAQGRRRVEIVEIIKTEPYLVAKARPVEEDNERTPEVTAMMQAVVNLFKRAVELNTNIPEEVIEYALDVDEPAWLADLITSTLSLSIPERQEVLELVDIEDRLHHVAMLLGKELSMLELKDEINSQVQQEMDRGQREMYLREQMRVIQSELGEADIFQQELNEIREQIIQAALPPEINDKASRELARLMMIPPMAPEVGIIRTYIDWLTALPWTKASEDNLDIQNAQKVLDADHYGLPKIKDRILEFMAVRKLAAEKMKSPILCFVGPPGVGKTSLGKSIARALGREFVRVSLGGVRDEAEIRGHRRTYIGAMPGRIIQTIRRAGTVNPIFMLDEIDKLGTDFRGDPSAALLEVLDPEQNNAYSDHYLEVPYDLSKVLFIATANELDTLPPALLDRLEVIEFPGYVEEEKLAIAHQFLIPRQLEAHGLKDTGIRFEKNTLETIIREYTYEAGVRNLDREIANVFRKLARRVAEGKTYAKRITANQLIEYLGPPYYSELRANDQDAVGVATGLAWTPGGGDITTIEVSVVPGKGSVTMTGQLGEVMQESAQAAMSYMRSRAVDFDVPHEDFEDFDVHIHLPEGAVPKDGPSAGITLAAAVISAFTERKIRSDFAMTGEITLRGRVLPVGGIKEKVLAARRARIKNIILPTQNKKDLVDIPKNALRGLNITFVDDMQQVIDLALLEAPPKRQRDALRPADNEEEKETKTKKPRAAKKKKQETVEE